MQLFIVGPLGRLEAVPEYVLGSLRAVSLWATGQHSLLWHAPDRQCT